MSGALDESTRQSVAEGRETLGAMLSSAQSDLQRVFMVAVVGLVGTIYVLRRYVWDLLKADMFARMSPEIRQATEVVAITPFDVILLQVKIGLVVGLVLALPTFLWYSRDALRRRGLWPGERVARWKLAVISAFGLALSVLGVGYAYFLFFPLMFDFLATNAVQVGFEPTYSIVKWVQFIVLLTISFALAAQLPLVMSALAYAEIVPYETFRDRWRHAVVGIFVFGAVFSPPDPFTQVMWALPLIALYGFSLKLTQVVVVAKRSSTRVDVPAVAREHWTRIAAPALLAFLAVYGFFALEGIQTVNDLFGLIPAGYRPGPLPSLSAATGLSTPVAAALVGAAVAALTAVVALLFVLSRVLQRVDAGPAPASAGSPADIDLGELDAAGVRAAPPEVFDELPEGEVMRHANAALEDDDHAKAQALLDRLDEAEELAAAQAESEAATEQSGTATETAAGMLDAFTEGETTEEDVGGYYYDLAFVLESVTSKAFRLVAVFMVVLAGTFAWLYRGGIRRVKETFFGQMPPSLQPDVNIVTLHPVEALIFEVKFSTLLAVVVTLPLALYYAWPALKERGWVRGDARVMLVWGGSLLVGIVGGSAVGFLYVAPTVISWLAADAIQSNMVIAYRINNFGWLVVYTTVGIGILAEIPVSMLLFHVGDVARYRTLVGYWRHVVVALFAVGALLSPRGVFTMLLIALPAAAAYLFGLGLLWLVTLGGRRGGPRDGAEAA
ncbi:MAG: twin-arginine translocase subunit TatC [Halorientalis sp.]